MIEALGLVLGVMLLACSAPPEITIDFKNRSVNGVNVTTGTTQDVTRKFGEPDSTISTATDYYYLEEGIIFNFDLSGKARYIYCVLNPALVSKWAEYSDIEKNKISTMPPRKNLIRKYSEKYFKNNFGEPRSKHTIILVGLGNVTELDYNSFSVLLKENKTFGIFLH